MRLPPEIREEFRRHGRAGGHARARRLSPDRRKAIARKAGLARWTRERFGEASFAALGLPGGELVDAGLSDLADERVSRESLLVSLAAPRLRREGVPVTRVDDDSEERLYELLERDNEALAHHRYLACLQQMHSFANACHLARRDHRRHAA
jgi:hypothetical protein